MFKLFEKLSAFARKQLVQKAIEKEQKEYTGRRAARMVKMYDRSRLEPGMAFKTSDGAVYQVGKSGAFVRAETLIRAGHGIPEPTVKERKRLRREMRANLRIQ